MFAIVLTACILIVGHILNPPVSYKSLDNQEALANNIQFESYFGNHVSAIEVKQLLSLVRSNNKGAESDNRSIRIYINSKDSTTSGADGIGVDIVQGTYYKVEVMNDKNTSSDTPISENDAGYYAEYATDYNYKKRYEDVPSISLFLVIVYIQITSLYSFSISIFVSPVISDIIS